MIDTGTFSLDRIIEISKRTTGAEKPRNLQAWIEHFTLAGHGEGLVDIVSSRDKPTYIVITKPSTIDLNREQFSNPLRRVGWRIVSTEPGVHRITGAFRESAGTAGSSWIRSSELPISITYDPVSVPPSTELDKTIDEIRELRWLPAGWNGYNVPSPKYDDTEAAVSWVEDMYGDVVEVGKEWIEPHVTADETGDVMLEWSKGDRELTAYISQQEVYLARDWGPDMESEMEGVDDPGPETRRAWWLWLVG
jgi:hypothetical protein